MYYYSGGAILDGEERTVLRGAVLRSKHRLLCNREVQVPKPVSKALKLVGARKVANLQ